METFLHQLSTILTTSPGNLTVHLILAFSIMMAFQAVFLVQHTRFTPVNGRLVLGLSALLAGQLALFFSSAMVWQGIADSQSFLPPLDRAVTAWSLVWIVWLWTSSLRPRMSDAVTGLFTLVVCLYLLFSLSIWVGQNQGVSFNHTLLDWGWGAFSSIILLVGFVFILIEKPPAWGTGLAIVLVNLAGFAAHFLFVSPLGEFSAAVRLAQMATFPLLTHLAIQLTLAGIAGPAAVDSQGQDPKLLVTWLQVAVNRNRFERVGPALTRAIAQTLHADLCFLIPYPTDERLNFVCGYERSQDETLADTRIEQSRLPALSGAVLRGRALRLGAGGDITEDLQSLAAAFELKETGSVLAVPLIDGEKVWGSLLLMSPYTQTMWGTTEQNYLAASSDRIVQILEAPNQPVHGPADSNVESLLDENRWLRQQLVQLEEERDRLTGSLTELKEDSAQGPQIDSLLALQQESQLNIQQLQEDNDRLQSALDVIQNLSLPGSADAAKHLEGELRQALEECAYLQNALASANSKILALENGGDSGAVLSLDDKELILSTLEELRQPVTSILGYTDILMSESIGPLGNLQHKFMERVRAANGRMRYLIGELIRILLSGNGDFDLDPVSVDVMDVIDAVITQTRDQISEKDITLQLELPENLPLLHADRDAVEQIVQQLMHNAGSVTPEKGVIRLHAHEESSEGGRFLLLQVTDSGGGIADDDLHRVFWRHFRADSPTIPGMGDHGIGLSIARALVEAHGGRIWVESQAGQSTTYNVLLPFRTHPPEKKANELE
jgi:signal transduction histidine kinase